VWLEKNFEGGKDRDEQETHNAKYVLEKTTVSKLKAAEFNIAKVVVPWLGWQSRLAD